MNKLATLFFRPLIFFPFSTSLPRWTFFVRAMHSTMYSLHWLYRFFLFLCSQIYRQHNLASRFIIFIVRSGVHHVKEIPLNRDIITFSFRHHGDLQPSTFPVTRRIDGLQMSYSMLRSSRVSGHDRPSLEKSPLPTIWMELFFLPMEPPRSSPSSAACGHPTPNREATISSTLRSVWYVCTLYIPWCRIFSSLLPSHGFSFKVFLYSKIVHVNDSWNEFHFPSISQELISRMQPPPCFTCRNITGVVTTPSSASSVVKTTKLLGISRSSNRSLHFHRPTPSSFSQVPFPFIADCVFYFRNMNFICLHVTRVHVQNKQVVDILDSNISMSPCSFSWIDFFIFVRINSAV